MSIIDEDNMRALNLLGSLDSMDDAISLFASNYMKYRQVDVRVGLNYSYSMFDNYINRYTDENDLISYFHLIAAYRALQYTVRHHGRSYIALVLLGYMKLCFGACKSACKYLEAALSIHASPELQYNYIAAQFACRRFDIAMVTSEGLLRSLSTANLCDHIDEVRPGIIATIYMYYVYSGILSGKYSDVNDVLNHMEHEHLMPNGCLYTFGLDMCNRVVCESLFNSKCLSDSSKGFTVDEHCESDEPLNRDIGLKIRIQVKIVERLLRGFAMRKTCKKLFEWLAPQMITPKQSQRRWQFFECYYADCPIHKHPVS